jgi:hypothetical protein
MIVIAIDPGPTTSGVVVLDATDWPPMVLEAYRALDLDAVRARIDRPCEIVVEGIVPYLRARKRKGGEDGETGVVGGPTIDTARTIGRIEEMAWSRCAAVHLLTRPEVGRILCPGAGGGVPTGAQIAEAIRDIYRRAHRATGGGVDPVIGTQREPGPLHGIAMSQHEGSALAVGLAWLMRERMR